MSGTTAGEKILIVGATGSVGSLVTPQLVERGENVRCMVRSEEKAEPLRNSGAEVVIGDLDQEETLQRAMEGVHTVFLVIATGPNMEQQGMNALEAATQTGVERLIRYSAIKVPEMSSMRSAVMQASIDAELESSGLRFSHVRPTNYMQGQLVAASTIQSDSAIYFPWGEGKVGMADLRDIAEAAVEVITGEGHDGQSYSITGPESINLHQVASAISEAIGKKISYVDVPPEDARDGLLAMGLDEWVVDEYVAYFDAFKNGCADLVTDDFTRLTGRTPRSINDFARDYAHFFNPELVPASS